MTLRKRIKTTDIPEVKNEEIQLQESLIELQHNHIEKSESSDTHGGKSALSFGANDEQSEFSFNGNALRQHK